MAAREKQIGYMKGNTVTDWYGAPFMSIIDKTVHKAPPEQWISNERVYFTARDENGVLWSGRGYGDGVNCYLYRKANQTA